MRPSCTVDPSTGNDSNEQSVVIDAQSVEKEDFHFFNNHAAGHGHEPAAGSELIDDLSPHSDVLTRRTVRAPASDRICPRQHADVRDRSVNFFSTMTLRKEKIHDHDGDFSEGGNPKCDLVTLLYCHTIQRSEINATLINIF